MGNVTTSDLVAIDNSSTVTNINSNVHTLRDEFDKVVYKDGREALTGNLDANSKRIINLPDAASNTEPITLGQFEAGVLGAGGDLAAEAVLRIAGDAARPTSASLSSSTGATLMGIIQSGTGAVLRTAQDEFRDVVKSNQFSTLQQAATAAAGKTLKIYGTYTLTSAVSLSDNTNVIFDETGVVQTATPNIDLFLVSGKTNVRIIGGKFKQTVAGGSVNAGIRFLNSTNCVAEANTFEGMQWAAILIDGCTNVRTRFNYVFASLDSAAGDKFDIVLYRSHYCTIDLNILWGGRNGGVLCQDPLGSGINVPTRNKIRYNIVGSSTISCKVYGIVVYLGGTAPTYNDVIGNHVENVLGDPAVQLDTGTGIYFVGSGLGGCKCEHNTVINACSLTVSASNGPAGITIADTPSTQVPVTVNNNTVDNQTRFAGILIVNCNGVDIGPNTVRLPSTNTGAYAGHALFIFNSTNIEISAGQYTNEGSGDAVLIFNTSFNVENISIIGTKVKSANGNGLRVAQTGGYTVTSLTVIGMTGTAATAFAVDKCDLAIFSGINIRSTAVYAASINAVTNSLFESCILKGTGTYALFTNGVCTNTRVGISNILVGAVENNATGLIVTKYGTAAPVAPNVCAIGDTTVNSVPVVGQPKEWKCTAAPNTHVSTGNL